MGDGESFSKGFLLAHSVAGLWHSIFTADLICQLPLARKCALPSSYKACLNPTSIVPKQFRQISILLKLLELK
jgi:hypothetical protein